MKISTGNLKSVRTTVVSCWAVLQHMSTTPHAALVLVYSSLDTFTADITNAYSIHVYPLFKCFFKGRVSKRSRLRRKAKLAKLELVSVPTSLYYTGPPTKGDRACELQVRSLLQRSGPEFLLAFGLSLDITKDSIGAYIKHGQRIPQILPWIHWLLISILDVQLAMQKPSSLFKSRLQEGQPMQPAALVEAWHVGSLGADIGFPP